MSARLDVSALHIVLDGLTVVEDVSMSVEPGEFVAVLGANGSGKSTLIRAAMGLVPIADGEVRLFGSRLREFGEWERIGYVPQRITATAGVPATVGEVVMSGRLARRRLFGLWNRGDRAAVHEALEQVDLEDRIVDPIAELSGGQQQRALIARALATRPDLLVMDEPTAGVDHDNQVRLAETLSALASRGCSIVFITHDVGPFAAHLDRAVVMRQGQVAHDGAVPRPGDAHAGHEHPHTSEPTTTRDLRGEGMWR